MQLSEIIKAVRVERKVVWMENRVLGYLLKAELSKFAD